MAILSICLRVDGCANLRGKFGTKLGHGALKLPQESGKFILLLWFALAVGVSMLPGCTCLLTLAVLRGLGLRRVVLL